jgi:protein O-mannosyl-transferase
MNRGDFNQASFILKTIIPLLIALIAFFTYGEVRHYKFINFDDNAYVYNNDPVQQGLTPKSIKWAFTFTENAYWHPLTWISHMADCQLFGVSPGPPHLVNLAIHVLNAIILFFVLFKMTGARYKAAMVAALFAIHPVTVESVAWVAERKTLLSMLFLLIALYTYVHYTEKKQIRLYCLVLFLYLLGLLCKPSIVIFPALLLLMDYWPLGRFGSRDTHISDETGGVTSDQRTLARFPAIRRSNVPSLILEKIPFFILSLISTYLTMISQLKFDVVVSHDLVPLDLRVYNLFVSIMKYLWNMVWPFELSIFYPYPTSIPTAHFLWASASLVVITTVFILLRRSRPWLVAGWFWFLVALAPASGLIQGGLWPEMANRWMYIPMIGLFTMLVWECDERISGRHSNILKAILCCAMLLYFIPLTKTQSHYFSNSYALFARAASVTKDNYIAYNNIGDALASLNRLDEAAQYFKKAIALNHKFALPVYNYGLYLQIRGDDSNAASYYSQAIAINPKFAPSYANMGMIQQRRGDLEAAKKLIAKAVEIDPDNGNFHNNFGIILGAQGKQEEAIRHFRIALENKPNFVLPKLNLAAAYEKSGRYDEAAAEYEMLNKTNPTGRGENYYRIAGVKARQNKFEECRSYLDSSLRLGFDVATRLKSDGRFTKFKETAIYKQLLENQTLSSK